jgi:hypothetical protein
MAGKASTTLSWQRDCGTAGQRRRGAVLLAGLLLALALICLLPSVASATVSAGPNDAGTGADVTGVGTIAWSNPGNVTTTGVATATLNNATSHYLRGTGYGFTSLSVPTGATIEGIAVTVARWASGSNVADSRVCLVKNGTVQSGTGQNLASGTNWSTTSGSTATYGGASNLWNNTWASSDITNANFGVAISTSNTNFGSRTASVDYIRVTVYYSVGLTVGFTASSKTFDGTTDATISSPVITSGVIGSDDVTVAVAGGATGTFASASVGTGKSVSAAASDFTLGGTSASKYAITTVTSTTADITARPITVTAVTSTRTYDGTTSSGGTPTLTGTLAAGDAATRTQTFDTKNVGTNKTLTPAIAFTSGSASNYAITLTNNTTGSITARAITVTAVTSSKTYDGTTSSSGTPTLTGTLGTGDAATRSQAFDTIHVGTNRTLTPAITFTSGSASNYSITLVNNTTGSITARAITVTAVTSSKTYDGTTASSGTPTLTSGTLATGDAATYSQTFANANVGTNKTLTPLASFTTGVASDYNITYANNTTGSITARPITVTAVTSTKAYDGTTSSSDTPTLTGTLGAGDAATRSQTFNNASIGINKTLTPAIAFTSGSASNYSITLTSVATGSITARPITVTAVTSTKTYDGTMSSSGTPALTSGTLATGDAATYSQTFASADAGTTKTLTPAISFTTGSASNYDITLVSVATGTITARPITVTAVTSSKTYDGTTSSSGTPTLTSGTLATGDAATYSQTFANADVGTSKTLTPLATFTSGSASNYDITYTDDTTGVITSRAITVTAVTSSKTYDGTTSSSGTPTLSSGTLGAGDAATYSQAFDTRHVGTDKTLTPLATFTSGSASNYDITYTDDTTGSISTRPITVTAVTSSRAYDGTVTSSDTPTLSFGTLGAGDSATLSETFDSANVGTDKTLTPLATFTAGTASDYDITYLDDTTGVISAAQLTVSFTAADKTYDGDADAAISSPAIDSGRIAPDVVSVGLAAGATGSFASKNVGLAKTVSAATSAFELSGADAGNYAVGTVVDDTADISARPITVTAGTDSRTYEGSTDSSVIPTLTSGTIATGDDAALSQTFDTKDVGTGKTLTPAIDFTTGSASNYDIALTPVTTGEISAAALTITAKDRSKTYGDALDLGATEFTAGGLVTGESIASVTLASTGAAEGADVGAYDVIASAAVAGPGTSLGNYDVGYDKGTLTVDPRALTITADDQAKILSQTFTFTGTEFTTSGLASGQSVTSATIDSLGAPAAAAVGAYDITIANAVAGPGTDFGNYDVSYVKGTFTVAESVQHITASAPGGHGTITPAAKDVAWGAPSGDFTVTPNAGYHLASLTDNGVEVTAAVADGTYAIAAVTADHTLVATFATNGAMPTSTVTGAVKGWSKRPVSLEFIGHPGAGGIPIAYTEYRLNGGAWNKGGSVKIARQGTTTVEYRAVGEDGITQAPAGKVRVRVDTRRPRIVAQPATGPARSQAKMKFRVVDPMPGCGQALVRLVIADFSGHILSRASTIPVPANKWCWVKISTGSLAPGVYHVSLRPMDIAGNFQRTVTDSSLTVR